MPETGADPIDDLTIAEDFEYLVRLLPQGWRSKAKELGALRRCRNVSDAETLLRVLLIHLAEGCSLRETALRIKRGKIANLSDVAIMDRLRLSGEWFRWMNTQLVSQWVMRQPSRIYGHELKVNLVDATRIKEPGPTGSTWSLHYCIDLVSLACRQLIVSDRRSSGESFRRFALRKGELYIGDRAYGVRPGIFYLTKGGAHVLVRFALDNLPLVQGRTKSFGLLRHLRSLKPAQIGDWPVELQWENQRLEGRVCAIKKSRQAAQQAQSKLIRRGQKQGATIKASTLESSAYVFVFTTLAPSQLEATQALELYRGRWQIELVFKRLKSILQLGHLRKIDPDSAQSWIEGKLFVALVIELLLRHAESFFPWGYPIIQASTLPLPVA